jgi:hypothetical protein
MRDPQLDERADSRNNGDRLHECQDSQDDGKPPHPLRVSVAFAARLLNCISKPAHCFNWRTLPLQAILCDARKFFVWEVPPLVSHLQRPSSHIPRGHHVLAIRQCQRVCRPLTLKRQVDDAISALSSAIHVTGHYHVGLGAVGSSPSRVRSANNWHNRHRFEKRTAAHARRRFERKNGRFWSAQFCTEVPSRKGLEPPTCGLGNCSSILLSYRDETPHSRRLFASAFANNRTDGCLGSRRAGLARCKAAPPRNPAPPQSISMFLATGKRQARGRRASKSTTLSIARHFYKSPAKRRERAWPPRAVTKVRAGAKSPMRRLRSRTRRRQTEHRPRCVCS